MAEGTRGPGLNVAILGHSHDGKTTLAASLLFAAGASPRLGSTDQGTALMDYEPEEQRRHISVQVGIACLRWKDLPLALLDTPGFQDFEGEVLEALGVADAAVLVVGANSAGQLPVGAETSWDLLADRQLPRLIVITKLDKEHADFKATYAGLQRRFSPKPIALQVPIGSEHSFKGVVDLLSGRAVLFGPQGGNTEADPPAEMVDEVNRRRQELVETIAETDDELLERYLDGQEPSADQLLTALRAATLQGKLAPVLVAASAQAQGAQPVLDALAACLGPAVKPPDREGAP